MSRKAWSFLDRDKLIAEFERTIVPGGRALVLCGGTGLGKSALIDQFEASASARGLAVALTRFTGTDPVDAVELMSDIAEQMPSAAFQSYGKLASSEADIAMDISMTGATQSITVAERASLRRVNMRDIIGQQINNTFILDQESRVSRHQQRLIKLTKHFVECLKIVANQQKVVLLFDDIGLPGFEAHKQSESSRWVERELLRPLARGRLPGIGVVLACREERPAIDDSIRSVSEIRYLEPLPKQHIIEYIFMRTEMERGPAEGYADLTLSHYHGNLKALGTVLDSWMIVYAQPLRVVAA